MFQRFYSTLCKKGPQQKVVQEGFTYLAICGAQSKRARQGTAGSGDVHCCTQLQSHRQIKFGALKNPMKLVKLKMQHHEHFGAFLCSYIPCKIEVFIKKKISANLVEEDQKGEEEDTTAEVSHEANLAIDNEWAF